MDWKSFNLGLWRGAHGRARNVPLARDIDETSYAAGFAHGKRHARLIRAGKKPPE